MRGALLAFWRMRNIDHIYLLLSEHRKQIGLDSQHLKRHKNTCQPHHQQLQKKNIKHANPPQISYEQEKSHPQTTRDNQDIV